MVMNWYYNLLAKKPLLVIVSVGVISLASIIVSLTVKKAPDFSDPTLGFEGRGTYIGQKLTAWYNLLSETRVSGKFVANPNELKYAQKMFVPSTEPKRKKKRKKKISFSKKIKFIKETPFNSTANDFDSATLEEYEQENNTLRHDIWNYGRNETYINDQTNNERIQLKKAQWKSLLNLNPPPLVTSVHTSTDGFFCESPNKEYSHLVLSRINHNLSESLFELNALLAMCELEYRITAINGYGDICDREYVSNNCCRPWSLPNYVALLSNKSLCFDIEQEDVLNVKKMLTDCFQYYNNMKLSDDCVQLRCNVPNECAQFNGVYNMLHYLADVEFMKDNNIFLKYAMIFLPIARSSKALPFYHATEKISLSNDLVSVVAIDMGLKYSLFDECLLMDGWLVGLGALFIIVCMWSYTASLFVTLMTIVAVFFSLGIAYSIYTFVFKLNFFPFMNLLGVIVLVGIGADDAFIFMKIWQCAIVDQVNGGGIYNSGTAFANDSTPKESLATLMANTLEHAVVSMLVTSFTTAAAFYAAFSSSITAVKCFGIFAGTSVIVNFILMCTWLPASVSLAERFNCCPPVFPKQLTLKFRFYEKKIADYGKLIENSIISVVLNVPKIIILVFGLIGVASCVIVLYWPKLRLPDSPGFQLFVSSHPFELYDSKFKNNFWFEKSYTSSESFKLPLRFIWGIEPVDRGDYMNPASRGHLYLDDSFNISLPESQLWLLNFCKSLKHQPFYQLKSFGMMLPNCFIENFISWMNRRCLDKMSDIDRSPCCEISKFPYLPHIFDYCLPQSISLLYETPQQFFIPGVAGPKFAVSNNLSESFDNSSLLVRALVVEYDSTQSDSMSYTETERFVSDVQSWFDKQLANAPKEMQKGWFISELSFYDLQDTLSRGTLLSIGLSMVISLLILMLVTLNILISVYAIITVTLTIFTTIAILVLLGWKLNVLESVAVTTAIGLAVDFSLHYGVHYRLAPASDRATSTRFALSRMIGPTLMAAITTSVAGVLMLPSQVLAYIQIGIFLVVVMTISWIYATFFLMSLLSFVGPQYGFGQFRYPSLIKRENKNGNNPLAENPNRLVNTSGTVSEQLLSGSSSAAGDLINSESHELESLTSNSIIRQPTGPLDSERPINFDQVFKKKYSYSKDDKSPSAASAITVVLPDSEEFYLKNHCGN